MSEQGTCGCGRTAGKITSGRWECGICWNWRKLDGPAARYWQPRMAAALENVDMHDVMTFLPDALGGTEAAYAFLKACQRVEQYSRGGQLAQQIR